MTPIVAVPPGEEEIGGTACLAGIALRQREQAGERAVDLTVLDHHLRLRRHHALRHALHRLSTTGPRTAMVTRNGDYARCAGAKGPARSADQGRDVSKARIGIAEIGRATCRERVCQYG